MNSANLAVTVQQRKDKSLGSAPIQSQLDKLLVPFEDSGKEFSVFL